MIHRLFKLKSNAMFLSSSERNSSNQQQQWSTLGGVEKDCLAQILSLIEGLVTVSTIYVLISTIRSAISWGESWKDFFLSFSFA